MSTKTTFKRIALVTVAALGFGLLSSVTPASAIATGLTASVGPNGATSLTVVGGDSSTAGALIRLDVTNSDTTTVPGGGLTTGETITASVTAPAGRTMTGSSVADTTTATGLTGTAARSDFIMLESDGQAQGTRAATAATAVSRPTNWTRLATATTASALYTDSATGLGGVANLARAADGRIGQENTGHTNMDTIHELTSFEYVNSYYVTVRARTAVSYTHLRAHET